VCRYSHTGRIFPCAKPKWLERSAFLLVNYRCSGLERRSNGARNMTASDTPNSAAEQKRAERLDVARTVYHALAAQDADRVITLCDIHGRLIARHDLRPEQGDPENAS
jgi:hypothetical protein